MVRDDWLQGVVERYADFGGRRPGPPGGGSHRTNTEHSNNGRSDEVGLRRGEKSLPPMGSLKDGP